MTILALILGVTLIWTVIAYMGAAQWLSNATDRTSFFRRWWTLIALLLVVRALQLLGESAEGTGDPSNPPWLETLVAEEWGAMAGTVIFVWGILFLFSGIRAIRRPVARPVLRAVLPPPDPAQALREPPSPSACGSFRVS